MPTGVKDTKLENKFLIITVMQVCSCDNCGFSYIHLGSAQFNLYNAKSQQQLPQVTF